MVPRGIQKEAHCRIGDMVLLRRGKQPEGSKFEARMCLGHFKVISVEQPSYGLGNAPGEKYRKPVHLVVYVDIKKRGTTFRW